MCYYHNMLKPWFNMLKPLVSCLGFFRAFYISFLFCILVVREIHRIATSTPESTDQVPNELAINNLAVYLYDNGLITLKDKNMLCGTLHPKKK